MTEPIGRLRRRLTLWYTLTLGTIVLALGSGLFLVIRDQIASQLDVSLRGAVDAIERAANIREREAAAVEGPVVDAVAELRIPDRQLYLFDARGVSVVPATAPGRIRAMALRALRDSAVTATSELPHERSLRVHAERFRTSSGRVYVAAAEADQVELEDQYAALIATFGAAALAALVLFTGVGWFLTETSVRPVARTMESMRRFMADAAHEFRTPLAVIRARADVALERTDGAGDRDALIAIAGQSARLGAMVDSLLLLARSDAGAWPVALAQLYLDDVVSDAVSAARGLAERAALTLRVEEFDETPIIGDAALLHRLVLILLDNAIKFTPPGGEVRVAALREEAVAVLRISDTGIGIPPEQQSQVFERFFRGDSARTRQDGAGLGLAIARWIAAEHRAEIRLDSAPGAGTTVAVRFPIASVAVSSPRQLP